MLMAAPLTEKDKIAIRNILFNAEQQTGQRVIDLLEEGGAGIDSIVGGNAIAVDNSDPQNPIINALVPPLPLGNGLLSGGRVTWIQNYDYEVSAAVYVIDGVLYQTLNYPAPIAITLTPADPLLDRIDTFALTTSNTAIAITGTPSAPPVLEPDVDVTTQLRIAFALVTANTTQPTPSLPTESIYLENTEWVTSVSAGTWNPNSTNNPYAGTKDIEGTAVAANQSITFTPALFPSLILLDSLIFKIRSKATWNNPSRLVFQFRNGNVNVGVAVQLNNNAFGFNSSDILNYQNINIDLALFGNIAAATNLRITKLGNGTIGFYLDNIQMVGNNNVVALPQVQPDWASGVAPAAILNKSVTRTRAQMLALQAASAFDMNMWYIISNPMSSFGVLRIRARDTSNLEAKGTLIKGGVAYDVNYVLDDGFGADGFSYFFDSINQNTLIQYPDGIDGILSQIPFDQSYFANTIKGGSYTLSDVTRVTINNSFLDTCTVNLDDNGSTDPVGAQLANTTAIGSSITITGDSGGVKSLITGLKSGTNCAASALNGATITDSTIINASIIVVDDNGADNQSAASVVFVDGSTILNITGVSTGAGTVLTGCEITGMSGSVTIAGGETYSGKILNKRVSTFDKSRIIAADGAFDFIVSGYNQSFVGEWTITAAAPRNVTSFTNRISPYEHFTTYRLGAGSAPITFVDDGVAVIMKGSAAAALTAEGDYVTFRFVGNVGYEIDRGIY